MLKETAYTVACMWQCAISKAERWEKARKTSVSFFKQVFSDWRYTQAKLQEIIGSGVQPLTNKNKGGYYTPSPDAWKHLRPSPLN